MTLVYSKYYDLHKKLNHSLGSWQTIRDLTLKILEWLTGQPKRGHKISTKMTTKALGILKERGEVKIKPKSYYF